MMLRIVMVAAIAAVLARPAAAQIVPPAAPPAGVTATGHAAERHTADAVRVTANLNATPGVNLSDRTDAVLRAFAAAGITDATAGLGVPNAGSATVSGTLRAPTVEKLRALARDVASPSGTVTMPPPAPPSAAPGMTPAPVPVPVPRTLLVPFGGTNLSYALVADDCSAAAARAQAEAIDDAREHAAGAAQTAGVRLGNVVALNVIDVPPPGCPASRGSAVSPFSYVAGDAAHPFDIIISATATVTYAIGGYGRRAP